MRIAYLVFWDLSQESGVLKKIAGQMRAWSGQGHTAKLFALSPDEQKWAGIQDLDTEIVPAGNALARFWRAAALARKVLAWQPDLVYLRYATYYPPYEHLMITVPTVLEINTDDLAESRLTLSPLRYLYHRLTHHRLQRRAAGRVYVSGELAQRSKSTGAPWVVIANGIDLSAFPELPAPDNPTPRLAFLGVPWNLGDIRSNWHGYDKLAGLAAAFPAWEFDLIGISARATAFAFPPNVHLHGYLTKQEYESILARADAGIGTLALHRKRMEEACPLKVREYLAYGLPVIIAYQDTDFPEPVSFVLQLPNEEHNLQRSQAEIERFVLRWQGFRVHRESILHLDVNQKEKQRLAFFERVLGGEQRPPAG